MIFDYKVKCNGQYYNAGQEVPIGEPIKNNFEQNYDVELPFSDQEINMETEPHIYTYEELEPMTAKEIRRLAEDKGIRITKTIKDDIINEFLSKQ